MPKGQLAPLPFLGGTELEVELDLVMTPVLGRGEDLILVVAEGPGVVDDDAVVVVLMGSTAIGFLVCGRGGVGTKRSLGGGVSILL